MTARRTPAKAAGDAAPGKAMLSRLTTMETSIAALGVTVTTLAADVTAVKDAVTRNREITSDNERAITRVAAEMTEQTKALKDELAKERQARENDRTEFLAALRKQGEASADSLTKLSEQFTTAMKQQNEAAVVALKDALFRDVGRRIMSWAATAAVGLGGGFLLWTKR